MEVIISRRYVPNGRMLYSPGLPCRAPAEPYQPSKPDECCLAHTNRDSARWMDGELDQRRQQDEEAHGTRGERQALLGAPASVRGPWQYLAGRQRHE